MKKAFLVPLLLTVLLLALAWPLHCHIYVHDPFGLQQKKIDRLIGQIDSKSDLESLRIPILGQSAEGGEMVAILENGQPLKITATFMGETGRINLIFYMDSYGLRYAQSEEVTYDRPIYVEGVQELSSKKGQFYFKEGKMIRWSGEVASKENRCSAEFSQWEHRLLENFSLLTSQYEMHGEG